MKYPEYLIESHEKWGDTYYFTEQAKPGFLANLAEIFSCSLEELEQECREECTEYELVKVLNDGSALYKPFWGDDTEMVVVDEATNEPGVYEKLYFISKESAEEL